MRVEIRYTVEVDGEFRRALRDYYGRPGLATREEVRDWYKGRGDSCDMDMLYEFRQQGEEGGSRNVQTRD